MIIGEQPNLDADKLKPIVDIFKENKDLYYYHHTKSRVTYGLGPRGNTHIPNTIDPNFWKNHEDIFDYLTKNVYPENVPIFDSWINIYKPNSKMGTSKGEFFGLHQDKYDDPDDMGKSLMHTTSILLDATEDIKGGHIVIAGDSQDTGAYEDRWKDTRDIMSRLSVIEMKKPGERCVWNGETLHGVSEVEQGCRITLVIIKKTDWDENYFKIRDYENG